MSRKESAAGYLNVIKTYTSHNAVRIYEPNEFVSKQRVFTYDGVYGPSSTQEQLYKETVEPVVDSVLEGFNGTIFAFGQTGTGKTYTMEGKRSPKEKGIMTRSFKQIFDQISLNKHKRYVVECSYIEIYQEELIDLFDDNKKKKPYEIRGNQSNVFVTNIVTHVAKHAEHMEYMLRIGNIKRKVGATSMNDRSSRSHAIFTITISITENICGIEHIKRGKLHLVDLSGSERQSKSQSAGIRLKEATKINFSLTVLGTVISALCRPNISHVPYRNCKLTRLLQDALGGNSKTVMIANIGPASYNHTESLNTLKYANQAKNIKNKPILDNNSNIDEVLNQMQLEIERLTACVQKRKAKRDRINLPIQKKINDEVINACNTFEKLQRLLAKRNAIEERAGTDVESHVSTQSAKHFRLFKEIVDVKETNEILKEHIDVKERAIYIFTKLSIGVARCMRDNIVQLHTMMHTIYRIRRDISNFRQQVDIKRYRLEVDHWQALKLYKLIRIIFQEFSEKFVKQGFFHR